MNNLLIIAKIIKLSAATNLVVQFSLSAIISSHIIINFISLMNLDYLDFEQPIADLEGKIQALSNINDKVNVAKEMETLKSKSNALTKKIFSSLSDWQISQLARHPKRLSTLDYIDSVFDEFTELHGDRAFADDHAIVGGLAKLDGQPVMFIGQQKGNSTREKLLHNFGMPRPEGYRKALRLMKLAEKFSVPIITFIDTPGAYPGIGAEERGQSEAIARNLYEMSTLETPIISVVIGEGGSGGALAIGVADIMIMFEYSIYSVISPEGCANIIWKDTEHAAQAAEAMGVTSTTLQELGIVDATIEEPLGGAHRDPDLMAQRIKDHLLTQLDILQGLPQEDLLAKRFQRLMSYGN